MTETAPVQLVEQRLKRIVMEHLGVDEAKVTPVASFMDDLGADSLDTVEIVMAIEEEFSIELTDDESEQIKTFGDAMALLKSKVK